MGADGVRDPARGLELSSVSTLAGAFGQLAELLGEALAEVDLFDRVQLREVIGICRRSRNLSDAGRTLFSASRQKRSSTNDADRLRKYLARFGLRWEQIAAG